ncbi:hypothetical protein AURDEDRAFT_170830 [Auricularia subglabra TFB-10046 SS5]|nr:hypothetical protein AURDEDRAFT_170830 [Auricularia subglabra TFB-10046 SS5]
MKLADFLAIPGQQMANRGRLMAYAHRNGLGTGILTALAHADWSADVMNTSIEVLIEDEDAVSPEWEGLVCGFDVVLAKADERLQGPIDPDPERDASVTARAPDAERNDTMHAAPKAERDETKDKAPDPARDEPKDKAPKPARDEPKDNAPKPERDATKDNASDPARDKTKDGAPDPKRAEGVDADWDAAVTGTSAATTPSSTSPSPSPLSPSVGVSTELTSASDVTPSPTEERPLDASKPDDTGNRGSLARDTAASRDTAPPPVSAERHVPPQPNTTPPPIPPPPPPPRASTGRHVLPHPATTPPPRSPPPPPPAGSAAPTRFRMVLRVSQPRRLTGLLAMHDDDDE